MKTERKGEKITNRTDSRLPVLDGVRGVAALTVLISHAANAGWIPSFLGHGNGKMAVGLFFILSGFLMTWLYAAKSVSYVSTYATHRFARVVPLYIVIVCLSILFPWALFPIDTPGKIVEHLGFLFGIETLWTIPVEIQFYFLFVAIWMSPRRAFPLLLLLQAACAVLFHFLGIPALTLPFWLHLFLIGSVIAFAWRRFGDRLVQRAKPYGKWGWAILVFASLATPGLRVSIGQPEIPLFLDPIAVTALVLLFTGSLMGLGPLTGFSAPWARWLGKVSYGVYLIHYPVLMAIGRLDLPGPVLFAMGLGITLALAALSFNLFEDPLRRRLTARSLEPRPAGTMVTPSAP
jgi:peptidoglycan/LPS O-acetylase OafA/YrhL